MAPDRELLLRYLDTRADDAFAELVRRYLPLVHSAALRRVSGDAQRAQEIAQAVFILFARKAPTLRDHPTLTGWLYTATHHTAAKLLRAERRRARHERAALSPAMNAPADNSSLIDWTRVAPVIDEVILQLPAADRTAVLLRFFDQRPYRDIGAQLGLSENAVRMRVERALETLRGALSRRGIASTAAAIGTALAQHAVVAPPGALAAAIAGGAAAAGAASGGVSLFMSSLALKTGGVAIGVAAALGLFLQHHQIVQLRAEVAQLQLRASHAVPSPTSSVKVDLGAEIARSRVEIAQLKSSPALALEERMTRLRQLLQRSPELAVPEIALATDADWIEAAREELETEADYRRALATLRNRVIGKTTALMQPALRQYLAANADQFPSEVSQLQPYMERSLGPAIWQHYEIVPARLIFNMGMGGDWAIIQKAPVDEQYDMQFVVGPRGAGNTSYGNAGLQAVKEAFTAANPGQRLTEMAQLLPYATTPDQRAALKRAMTKPMAGETKTEKR